LQLVLQQLGLELRRLRLRSLVRLRHVDAYEQLRLRRRDDGQYVRNGHCDRHADSGPDWFDRSDTSGHWHNPGHRHIARAEFGPDSESTDFHAGSAAAFDSVGAVSARGWPADSWPQHIVGADQC
jgi:hypothetical protein